MGNFVEPSIEERGDQHYVGIRRTVTMDTIGQIADQIPVLFGWLAQHGLTPAGPPFLRYLVIDMERELVIEAGVPTADIVAGDSEGGNEVLDAVLPGGRYVTTTYTGSYDELVDVTTQFLQWATDHDLTWDAQDTEAGEAWGCRLELFLTNPAEQPDPSQNVTQLAFRLADG